MTSRIFEYYKIKDLSLGPHSKTPVLDNILCNKSIRISNQVLGLLESKLSLVPVWGERIDWGASWKQTEIPRYLFHWQKFKGMFLGSTKSTTNNNNTIINNTTSTTTNNNKSNFNGFWHTWNYPSFYKLDHFPPL